jgi:two-component system OmpR family sensor kinase
MVMGSTYRLPFHRRLFVYIIIFAFFYLLCFLVFQYQKEKKYKVERLNDRLQIVNTQAYYAYREKNNMALFVRHHNEGEFRGLRITVIDLHGNVLYDSKGIPARMPNHSNRPEVRQAMQTGEGYILSRRSSTMHLTYFYNATRCDNLIIRSALPYSLTLVDVLRVDRNFIWFMIVCALTVSILSYMMTHRLGHNISHLREFAVKAENGERIDDIEPFMKDELGDVSNAIVRLYIQLRQAKDALLNEHNLVIHQEQEQIRIKRQLTQNINHELKTPVSSIEGYLETIINNPQLDEAKKNEFIEKCYGQVIRMSNLLGDVSTITRMDEGGSVISKEKVCLSSLIHEVFEDLTPKLKEKAITHVFDFPNNLYIIGNQSLLQSIFRNLLDNAIAYSGCNTIFVSLIEESVERYVFSFADNGVGIDEEHLPRIFERFYRIDKGRSRKLGGTGLGLSIVKNAVIFHGGAIVARTRNGGGLEFIFALKKGIQD